MKDWRWADSSEDLWGCVEEEEWLDPIRYFPHYYRKENGNLGVGGRGQESHKEYPGKVSSPGLMQRLRGINFGRRKYKEIENLSIVVMYLHSIVNYNNIKYVLLYVSFELNQRSHYVFSNNTVEPNFGRSARGLNSPSPFPKNPTSRRYSQGSSDAVHHVERSR